MNFNKSFKVGCFVLLVMCSLTKSRYLELKEVPHILIFDQYGEDFQDFQAELDILSEVINEYSQSIGSDRLKAQLLNTRLAYKKIEFIFDYLEPNYAYLYVNGGPLPKLHKEVAEIDIIWPNGLQRLDELVFLEDIKDCISEIKAKTKELNNAVAFIKDSHLSDTISKQNSFELLRSGIVRVFTLGITGFDTPGSGNSMIESIVSLKSMRKSFSFYGSNLKQGQQLHFNKILRLYQKGISKLEKQDFDSFDRLEFLKSVVNPIYKELLIFQKSLDVSTKSLNVHAQDYASGNIFDESFLDINYYSQFNYSDINNEATIDLGKTLFYDPILSKKMDMSCASCHNPKLGFADGLSKSLTNSQGVFTKRNSPTLIDAAYSSKYFWDMREHDLEKQVAHVVEDSLEFNIGFREIVKRLNQSEEYLEKFEDAFAGISKQAINRRSISNAIASYVNTLKSFDSPFDRHVRGDEELDESAKNGFNLFMGKAACGTCHFAPAFNGSVPPFYTDAESEVLGVTDGYNPDNPTIDKDSGRSNNGRKGDMHPHFEKSFKTVTVRNSALTAPYMHNGSFTNLEEVIDFYDQGGGVGMGLNIDNQTLSSDSLQLSTEEKQQLISFLHSLTDTSGLDPGKIELPEFKNQPYWNKRGRIRVID